MKRILSVLVRHEHDTDPDTAWLGKWSARIPSRQHYIDRRTGELFNENGHIAATHPDGGVFVDNYSCEYFIPGPNHVPHNPKSWKGLGKRIDVNGKMVTPRQADYLYALDDWRRMEDINNGEIGFIGIKAEAHVQFIEHGTVQEIQSSGLWGIESDSGQEYFDSVAAQQLAELRCELEAVGFTTDEIDQAFASKKEVAA